jgi:hypothetical protein
MRIRVIAPREDPEKQFRLFLPVPLGIARWRFIWRFLPEEARLYAPVAAELVRALKQYKREYGSWNLVEVKTADGKTHVEIKI